jgi:hypothetical protein
MIVEDGPCEAGLGSGRATSPTYSLEAGRYVVPEKAYGLHRSDHHGVEGLCITHLDPEGGAKEVGL